MLGVAGTVYFYLLSNDLTAQIEQMEKKHAVEMQAAIDSPYPPAEYYIEQLEQLQEENAQLRDELEHQN